MSGRMINFSTSFNLSVQCAVRIGKVVYESRWMSLFFDSQRKVTKRKLPAASDSVEVSGLAWSVLPEPANAGFLGYLRFVRVVFSFPVSR
jgi:hypothetical protein